MVQETKVGATPQEVAPTPIDIIMPVHGRPELTITAIKHLYTYTTAPFHLIVLDDTDASIKQGAFHRVDPTDVTSSYFAGLVKQKPNITYVNAPQPYSCGNQFFNEGLKYCKHEYFATIMNSLTVDRDWEQHALQLMNTNPEIGIVGFKNLFPNGVIESAGIVFNNFTPCDYGRDEPAHHLTTDYEPDAVQWAFALVRKKAAVGNLPEDIFHGFVGWDDIDNCLILRSKGWKVFYCGHGAGTHVPRATRGDNSPEATWKNKENAYNVYKRWGLWQKYQEAQKMDVSYRLSPELKEKLSAVIIENQVLKQVLNERNAQMNKLCAEALKELSVEPDKYVLEVNPIMNIWEMRAVTQATEESRNNGEGETKQLGNTKELIASPVEEKN